MKKWIAVFLSMVLAFLPVLPVYPAAEFSDMAGHWAETDVRWLAEQGIAEGDGGAFIPEGQITRAEFLAMTVRAFGLSGGAEEYRDVSEQDWFYPAVCAGAKLVPAEMAADGLFLPNSPITREEMAAALSRALSKEGKQELSYADGAEISAWAAEYVQNVSALGIMTGDGGYFMPQSLSTRAQAAAVLHRALSGEQASKSGRGAYPSADVDVDIRSVDTQFLPVPSEEQLAEHFPIMQQMRPVADMKYISGVGMVAYFEEGGPREVYVRRDSHAQHNPDTTRYKQLCTARVIDPDGEVVCYYDFSDKDLEQDEVVFKVPEGKAGIYQISYKNGQNNVDDVTIGIPQSSAWGIRGEPTLSFTEKTDKEWYLYIPRTSKQVEVFTRGSQKGMIDIYDENGNAFAKDTAALLKNFVIPVTKTDVVWKVVFSGTQDAAITFLKGVPQVLCKTEEMARFLKGLTQEAQGLLVSGGMQAQAREIAYSMKDNNFDVELDFPEEIPEDVTEYDIEALMYGIYSGLGTLKKALPTQCLDPESPYYGGTDSDGKQIEEFDTWEDFDPPSRWSLTTAAAIASLASIPTKLNPAYQNQALIDRAVLNAFCHLTSMDNTFLIREGSGSTNQFWPNSHSFFIYPSIATAYNLLKDKLDPETRTVFRRGLILLGDGLANAVNSQTNQWQESTMGHLEVYLATGEERFLEYYERNIVAMASDNVDRASGSYGQHPAGYFMEQHGPEGSYQELSMHKFVGGFCYYRNLPEADPEVLAIMEDAIDRAIVFESLFWLPQPDGALLSPNSMNTRSVMMMSNQGYPGFAMAATVNPLAAKVFEMLPVSPENLGSVVVMPQGALNKPEVAKELIRQGLAGKDDRWPERSGSFGGGFIPMVYNAYRQEDRVEPAGVAPVYETNKTWDLEGMPSFKRGRMYGMSFYNSNGISSASYPAARNPLPAVIWTEKLGSVVLSCNNKNLDQSERPQMGYSGLIIQKADGSYYKTTTDNSSLRWIEEGTKYEMDCPIPAISGNMKVRGEIANDRWKMSVYVSAGEAVKNAYVSLPINVLEKEAVITEPENGSFTYSMNGETLHINYSENANAYFDEFVIDSGSTPKIRTLKIELPLYNRPLELEFYVE